MKTKLYLTVLFLLQAFIGLAQPGEIDITFNASGAGAFTGTSSTSDCIVYKSKVYEDDGVNKDKIIIVGRFNKFNSVNREYIARLNADGTLDTTFNGPDFGGGQYIYCTAIQPDGKIIIGGGFTIAGSPSYTGIARLNDDGSLDTTFNAGSGSRGTASTGAVVHAITLQPDGKILFGGSFSTYNGVTCKANLNRLETNGTLDATFNSSAGAINGEVRAIALQNTKIIAGGFFTGYSYPSPTPGHSKNRILRLNSNGSYDATFNPYTGTAIGATGGSSGFGVYDIYVMPTVASPPPGSLSEYVYVVGKFTKYNNVDKVSVMRLTPNGLLDTSFTSNLKIEESATTDDPGWGYVAFAVRPQPDGKMLIGGNFRTYNENLTPKGLIRIETTGIQDATFLTGSGFQGGTNVYQGKSVIRDILLQSDGKIVVGGDFTVYDGTARRMLARIRTRECPFSATWEGSAWKGGVTPTLSHYMVIKTGTFTIPTGTHMQACELEIQTDRSLIIQPGASLTVNGIVMNNGFFTINNTGALVQIKEETKNADLGAGDFKMFRSTSPLKPYDFVYWSSPVENMTIHDLSPLTRFDKYFKYSPTIDNWVEITNGTEIMVEGKGYIARAPYNHVSGPQITYFQGRPHNGKITLPIENSVGNFNLIGNPYPSAIDANIFLNDTDNSTRIGGTIYLWSHATAISSASSGDYQYNYSESDYISYNKLGGTLTNPTGTLFAGKIAAGQGFFIEALSNTNVTFKNTMRLTGDNSQFYKNSPQQTVVNQAPSRLWIDFYNAQGSYKQALVGFTEGASMEMDRDYDGISLAGSVDFYSLVDNNKLVIQGRPLPFDNQTVPMGYMTPAAGTFKIALNQFDGLFNDQTVIVYLVDHLTNSMHNLKSGSYTFNTMAGTHNNRFELKFTTETLLSTVDNKDVANNTLVAGKNNIVSIAATESIASINIYDLTGKLLYTKQGIQTPTFATDQLNVQQQVVMVVLKFSNNQSLTKKVLLQ